MQTDEAMEIIRLIKTECDSAEDSCEGCAFCGIDGECQLVGNPSTWEI